MYTHTHTNTITHKHTHTKKFENTCVLFGSVGISLFGNCNSKISAMAQALRLCSNGGGRRASTNQSFLCRICFGKQAVLNGAHSSCNKCTICPGNTGNSGKSSTKGALGNAGNRVHKKNKKIAGRAGGVRIVLRVVFVKHEDKMRIRVRLARVRLEDN